LYLSNLARRPTNRENNLPDKILHVSCLVKEGHIYDLLAALEQHKVGNVEVRPVVPPLLALPPPSPPSHGKNKQAILAAIAPGATVRAVELGAKVGITTKQAASTLHNLMLAGVVRRVGFGKYRLTKTGNGK
jgi:hypothetical protein